MLLPSVKCPKAQPMNQGSHPTIRTDPSAQNQILRPRSPRKIHNIILLTGMLQVQPPFIKVQLYNSIIPVKIQWRSGQIKKLMILLNVCKKQGNADAYIFHMTALLPACYFLKKAGSRFC